MSRSNRRVRTRPTSSSQRSSAIGNRRHRDSYRFDRVVEAITDTFELEQPGRLVGAHVVASGLDVAVYVTIPDTVVRFRARQQQPRNFDRTTALLNVVESLAADDLDQLEPDPPEIVDRELAEMELPPITGWRVHRMWPEPMIDTAIGETCRLIGTAVEDIDVAADGIDYGAHREAIDGATNDLLHTVLQAPVAYLPVDDGRLLVPARLVFSALILALPTRGWRSRDLGRWQALTVDGVDLCVATTEPTWVVAPAS